MSDCKIGKNTGFPDCVTLFSKVVGFGLQDLVDQLGESNKLTTDVDGLVWTTVWAQMLANQDKTKRIYPVKGLLNVKPTREDDQYETAADGTKAFLRDGLTQYDFEHWNSSNVFYSKLKDQCACTSSRGVYLYTKEGIIVRKIGNEFYPIELSMLNAYYMPASDANVPKTMISMQFAAEVEISDLWLIEWSDLGSTLNLQQGLIDVNIAISDADVNGVLNVYLKTTSDYGKNKNKTNILGLTPANFVFKRVDNGATLTPTLFVYDEANGWYHVRFGAGLLQLNNVLSVTMAAGRFEGSASAQML